jgi:hypothetical protein
LADEDQDTEEEEPVDGVRGYDLAMRRRYANGCKINTCTLKMK